MKVNIIVIRQCTYLRPTYLQHGHQITLGNPMKKLLVERQLNRQNMTQFLHLVYNLQEGGGEAIQVSKFKAMWLIFWQKTCQSNRIGVIMMVDHWTSNQINII